MPGVTKITIDIINKYSKSRGVVCISNTYKNSKEKLKWKCLRCSFEFKSSKNNFDRYFNHCKNCYYNNGKINKYSKYLKNHDRPKKFSQHKKQLKYIVNSKGGVLLSDYKGSQELVKIRCIQGHVFSAKFCNIVNIGTWCPVCSDKRISISENIVRKYFESIFGYKFVKIRPNWLKNKNGYNLELDGYCKELSIAFEHQGPHHYDDIFKNNRLKSIQKNDIIKNDLCKRYGVKLFVIPHLFKKTKLKDLFEVIKKQAKYFGLNIENENINIDIKECYYDNRVFDLDLIAKKRGGRLLEKEYYGVINKKVEWMCKEGHIWQQYPYVIKRGSWCPVCAGYKKGTKLGANIIKE